MVNISDELLKKLMVVFRSEADEHLRAMSSGLLALEKAQAPDQRVDIVEAIFRDAHSLKGAARAVNLTLIESVCQSLESVFAALKRERLDLSPFLFDLLHEAIAVLGGLLAAEAPGGHQQSSVSVLTRRLDEASKGVAVALAALAEPAASGVAHMPPVTPVTPGLVPETVRVSTTKLDAVMRQAEELLVPRLAATQRASELHATTAALAVWKKRRLDIQPALRTVERALSPAKQEIGRIDGRDGTVNGSTAGRRELATLFEYLDAEQLHMKVLEERLVSLSHSAEHDRRVLAGMTEGLLHDVKEMQLLPFASLLEILPRYARELAREQGKDVELVIQGGEIEIDRRILEAMKDPLIYLLRNSIDHGIEKPAVRETRHKPPRGTITLAISQKDSGNAEVLVADDGAGIDAALVNAAADRLGSSSAVNGRRTSEHDALALIFASGVSTSPIITDVSGRGLGLAIVREKVDGLGGSIKVESQRGVGTAFRIILPLMLANFRGVIVHAGGQLFVIPAANVERVMSVAWKDVRTVENRETISLDGQAVAMVRLSDVLALPRSREVGPQAEAMEVAVLGQGGVRIAFGIEKILGEQEVLVKSLGPQLVRVRNIAGASVLGTGQVVPVLNVSDLLKSAVRHVVLPALLDDHLTVVKPGRADKPSILVVEDSITSRSLLTGILESAGYRVTAAVDGIDGYTTLKTGAFDLVVSDVEMPRMDGFDFTAKVRADKKLAQLPVVLVTALESREHRERGIDAGANAYIVKSSFDQSNLLEVIRRLL
jgi:two-component system, chemotaxis family, sensor kinase CheA